MWIALASLPGKLNTLLSRLTADRATKLDNLDAVVSTRAPSSTALSNAVWTDPLATKVNNIQDNVIRESSPIAAGFHVTGNDDNDGDGKNNIETMRLSINGTLVQVTSLTFEDAINVTGKGVINFIGVLPVQPGDPNYRLWIDGVMVAEDLRSSGTPGAINPIIGAGTVTGTSNVLTGVEFNQVPFSQSFRLELRNNGVSARTVGALLKYRRVE